MQEFRYVYEYSFNAIQDRYFHKDSVLLDIETTGFKASYQICYEIGLAKRISENSYEITLFFADSKEDERNILLALINYLEGINTIITFNGISFDLPFLVERFEKNDISFTFDKFDKTDLFIEAKSASNLLNLPRYNQTTIERFLGILREDTMNGGELIPVFKEYSKDHDEEKLKLLTLHNHDDVKGMLSLLNIMAYVELKKETVSVKKFELETDTALLVEAALNSNYPFDIRIKNDYFYAIINGSTIRASFPLIDGSFKCYYPNYKDYVYLVDEHTIVPKALSTTMNKASYIKATKDNCYTKIDPDTLTKEWLSQYISRLLSC